MQFIRKELAKKCVHNYFSVPSKLLSIPFVGKSLAFSDIPPKKGWNIESPIVIYLEKARLRERHQGTQT